jgi:hypothetical protein
MLRFPLNCWITFLTDGKFFIGRIINAGEKFLTIVDLVERVMTPTGEYLYTDNILGGKWYFDRNKISCFKRLDEKSMFAEENEYNENMQKTYKDAIAESRRSEFRIIKKIEPVFDEQEINNGK